MSTGSRQGGAEGPLFKRTLPAQQAQRESPGLVLQVRQEEMPSPNPALAQPCFGNGQSCWVFGQVMAVHATAGCLILLLRLSLDLSQCL